MANYVSNDGLRYFLTKLKLFFASKEELPTKVSDLTNDSQFITAAGAPVQSVNSKTGAVSLSADDIGAITLPQSATAGDILTYNGTDWVADDAPDTGVTSFNSRTGTVVPTAGDYTAAMVGAVATTAVGTANGVCPLGADSKVSSTYLPSYIDDVIEAYTIVGATPLSGEWLTLTEGSTSPLVPENGKIYIIMSAGDYQNMEYRWGGTVYVKISDSGLTPMTNAQIDDIFEE